MTRGGAEACRAIDDAFAKGQVVVAWSGDHDADASEPVAPQTPYAVVKVADDPGGRKKVLTLTSDGVSRVTLPADRFAKLFRRRRP